jgi:uncharacterized membrane protein
MSHDADPPRAKHEAHFRWRGREVTRLEGFSDAVFGFAVTLLVISLEVPKTFDDLLDAMRGTVAFAICFAILVWVWYEQHTFFRRYSLQDPVTVLLNACLLFIVLFYVYPLKFMFTMLSRLFLGFGIMIEAEGRSAVPMIRRADAGTLMAIYSLGFVAVFLIFTLLYRHADRRRDELQLDETEALLTRQHMVGHLLVAAIGLLSLVILAVGGSRAAGIAGWSYGLIGPVQGVYWRQMKRRRRRLAEARAGGADPEAAGRSEAG